MTKFSKDYSLFLNKYLYLSPKLILNLYNLVDSRDHFIEEFNHLRNTFKSLTPELLTKAKEFNFDQEIEHLNKHRVSILHLNDTDYPTYLKEISDPPLLLFYKGDISLVKKNQLAIVGPRKSTSYGTKVAEYFTKQLSPHFVITSGLADGIDAAAHKQCLTDKKQLLLL